MAREILYRMVCDNCTKSAFLTAWQRDIRDCPHTIHLAVTDAVDGLPVVQRIVHTVRKVVNVFAKRRLISERLEELQSKLEAGSATVLIQDVSVRWNSVLDSLERVYSLRKDISDAIQAEIRALGNSQAKDAVKTREKLGRVSMLFTVAQIDIPFLITILKPCKQASDAMEGDDGYVSQLIRVIDKLEKDLAVRRIKDHGLFVVLLIVYTENTRGCHPCHKIVGKRGR
jgi:hypothetical protein